MTCEVAVMNKRGIALAADSAVTLGNGRRIDRCCLAVQMRWVHLDQAQVSDSRNDTCCSVMTLTLSAVRPEVDF